MNFTLTVALSQLDNVSPCTIGIGDKMITSDFYPSRISEYVINYRYRLLSLCTGWASTETIVDLVRFIDSVMNPVHGTAELWLLVWDGPLQCPYKCDDKGTHQGYPFPHLCMAFVPGSSTGYSQPLDVAVMRPFKCRMKHHADIFMDAMSTHSDLVELCRNIRWKRGQILGLQLAKVR
eukprot:1262501-Amphidinium_carterae.1